MVRFTLSKHERLSSLKDIELLFAKGKSLTKYPFRLVWHSASEPCEHPVKVMFSVSKKKFRKAVDRNRVKRLMRESYRLQKPGFYKELPTNSSFHLALIYTAPEILDLSTIQNGLSKALERFVTQIRKDVPEV